MCEPDKNDKPPQSGPDGGPMTTVPRTLPHRGYVMFVLNKGLGPPGIEFKYSGGEERR